jgi:pre-rRNA-processing protein TSR2
MLSLNETKETEFQAGVTAVLRNWSALRTAVEQEWGGVHSAIKAENLRMDILASFIPQLKWSLDQLEDHLAIYMEDEFSVLLEDDSEREVAMLLWTLFEQCSNGDFALCRSLVYNNSSVLQRDKVLIQVEGEIDDEDECMGSVDEMEINTMEINAAKQYAAASLFGSIPSVRSETHVAPPPRQLGEASVKKNSLEVDEDGFSSVSYKKKGR